MGNFPRLIIFITMLLNGCVDPYHIKSVGYQGSLVVEGFISTDLVQHQVKLSRTAPINKPQFIAETGAQVNIKSGSGSIPLTEASPGIYLTPPLQGVVGNVYTLYITTQNGQQFQSGAVTLKDTPDIKNIYALYSSSVAPLSNSPGIQIFLDTDDSTHQAQYYRWEFIETWEIQTPFESEFEWLGGNNVVLRSIPVSTCYATDTSSNILIQSTHGLTNDKITAQVIQTLSADAQAMRIRYSILVKQFTLTESSYQYWQTLKNINEGQGTLYDIQPGTVVGNITSSNSGETALGYFDAGAVKAKRAFFRPSNFIASGYTPPDFESYCNFFTPIKIPVSQIGTFYNDPANLNFEITGATGFGDATLFLIPKVCCDCTSLGTNVKPSFWP